MYLAFARASLFSFVALLSVPGCVDDTDCTTQLVYGLVIRVEDADGDPICDAAVEAVDGDHREMLDPLGASPDCFYQGAGERTGRYTITVDKEGFESTSIEVRVTDDECHVESEFRTLTLVTPGGGA